MKKMPYILTIMALSANFLNAEYCYPCVNTDGGGSQVGNMNFQSVVSSTISEIEQIIDKTIDDTKRLNELQHQKILSTASMLEKMKDTQMNLEKISFNKTNSNKVKCLNIDTKLNQINLIIMQNEQKLANLKKGL